MASNEWSPLSALVATLLRVALVARDGSSKAGNKALFTHKYFISDRESITLCTHISQIQCVNIGNVKKD